MIFALPKSKKHKKKQRTKKYLWRKRVLRLNYCNNKKLEKGLVGNNNSKIYYHQMIRTLPYPPLLIIIIRLRKAVLQTEEEKTAPKKRFRNNNSKFPWRKKPLKPFAICCSLLSGKFKIKRKVHLFPQTILNNSCWNPASKISTTLFRQTIIYPQQQATATTNNRSTKNAGISLENRRKSNYNRKTSCVCLSSTPSSNKAT